ncbi:MAG: hypothetical protein OMM_10666 [Candidatus Magnetoglobus multicellularis str. Araruama]|uniref:PIN domain-containing protein n=1 Tax=Candidatus Magnetoglobus multicellularis str. Araruama TaxID=890399 RepID=A0A1V1P0G9_9BACT|nr:MAG: hypothetical protein OMM_10666 [Candidatus Magnetoglobus multicellularis str. Araruama]
MKSYFIDTSALVKRYITEIGSKWIQLLTDPNANNKLILSRITWIEILSAFSRLKRERVIDESIFDVALQSFEFDWYTQYHIVEFNESLSNNAGKLVKKHPLRAYDSVQLASALRVQKIMTNSLIFVSSDI